jgi:hypothetical protein
MQNRCILFDLFFSIAASTATTTTTEMTTTTVATTTLRSTMSSRLLHEKLKIFACLESFQTQAQACFLKMLEFICLSN